MGSKRKLKLRKLCVWRVLYCLCSLCRQFADILNSVHYQVERDDISLRLVIFFSKVKELNRDCKGIGIINSKHTKRRALTTYHKSLVQSLRLRGIHGDTDLLCKLNAIRSGIYDFDPI